VNTHLYQWALSAEQANDMLANGWEYAGESGRYPSVLLRRSIHCGACSPDTQETLTDLGRYADVCRFEKESST